MLGFVISIMIMVTAFLLIRSKIKLLFVWFISCFIPFFMFVYSEEQGEIEIARDISLIDMIEIYAGIVIVSLMWALIMLSISFVLFISLKWIYENIDNEMP